MRIEIEYNNNGEIVSVAGSGPTVNTGRLPRPNHRMLAVEAEEVRHERDLVGLRKIVESYRITGHPHQPCLTRK